MRVNPKAWADSPRAVVLVGVLVAVVVVAVVVMRALSDDPPDEPALAPFASASGSPETSGTPDASGSPDATESPDSKPSSGPTEVPEPGSLETVKVEEVSFAPPVGFDETGDFGTGLTLRVTDIEAVEGVARGPGQVSGPALRLTLEARNASTVPVSLEGMVVDLTYGANDTPAMPLSEPGARPFEGEVSARAEGAAVYVFAVPEESRGRVTVSTSYTGSAPTVVFRGSADRLPR